MSDIELVTLFEGLRKRDRKVLSEIYSQYYPLILGYVLRNGGVESDAKDIFQEAIIVVYKLAEDKNFTITESFGSFLMGIAKRILLKQIRQSIVHEKFVDQSEMDAYEDHPSELELENEHELHLIRKHIVNLGEDCRKVLMWSAEGLKNKEIAKKMGYKSEKVIRTKKYKCKDTLIKMIKQDPNFKASAP